MRLFGLQGVITPEEDSMALKEHFLVNEIEPGTKAELLLRSAVCWLVSVFSVICELKCKMLNQNSDASWANFSLYLRDTGRSFGIHPKYRIAQKVRFRLKSLSEAEVFVWIVMLFDFRLLFLSFGCLLYYMHINIGKHRERWNTWNGQYEMHGRII